MIADGAGAVQIGASDAAAVVQPKITATDLVVGEGDGYADVVVSLNSPSASTVTVAYSTNSGTASSYSDFEPTSGTLNFAPGETTKVVRLTLDENNTVEWTESFYLGLRSPVNAVLNNPDATITIVDNDTVLAAPSLYVQDVVVDEKAGTASFVVTLGRLQGQSSNSAITVDYATANGTAGQPGDYLSLIHI